MARIDYEYPVLSITGTVEKGSKVINRQKKYRDIHGNIIFAGANEAYTIRHPRDYTANPPTESEVQNQSLFAQACARTVQELSDPERLVYWQNRFQAQLRHPDADSPIDPSTGKPKIYHRLDNFVRACIRRTLS